MAGSQRECRLDEGNEVGRLEGENWTDTRDGLTGSRNAKEVKKRRAQSAVGEKLDWTASASWTSSSWRKKSTEVKVPEPGATSRNQVSCPNAFKKHRRDKFSELEANHLVDLVNFQNNWFIRQTKCGTLGSVFTKCM